MKQVKLHRLPTKQVKVHPHSTRLLGIRVKVQQLHIIQVRVQLQHIRLITILVSLLKQTQRLFTVQQLLLILREVRDQLLVHLEVQILVQLQPQDLHL